MCYPRLYSIVAKRKTLDSERNSNSRELTDIMIVCEGAFMSCLTFYTTLAGKIKTTNKVTRITKYEL